MVNPHQKVPVACLDIRRVARFCNSVGHAEAIKNYTEMKWVEYRESTVLNLLYRVMFWKEGPGTFEVTSDASAAGKHASVLATAYQKTFYEKLSESPKAAGQFMKKLELQRDMNTKWVQQLYANAADLNRQIAKDTTYYLIGMRAVKIGAAITISWTTAGAVPLAYGVTTGVIDNWDDLGGGSLVVAADLGSGKGVEKVAVAAAKRLDKETELVAQAKSQLDALNAKLMRKVSAAKKAKVGRAVVKQQGAVAAAQSSQKLATNLSRGAWIGGKALPVIFAVPDILTLIEDYQSL